MLCCETLRVIVLLSIPRCKTLRCTKGRSATMKRQGFSLPNDLLKPFLITILGIQMKNLWVKNFIIERILELHCRSNEVSCSYQLIN